jgi:hypothetical protein
MPTHHVYFAPGMFGFGQLGSFDYFAHVERELAARFAAAGHELRAHVIDELPTASVRRRATRLAEIVARTAGDEDPVHLLGHSTGGLDARLVASPATRSIPAPTLTWLPRLRSVTMMNTPHFGTPLASFFTTASGQRVLYALSIMTFTVLSLGAQPLAAASVLLGFLRRGDRGFPFKVQILDRAVASVLGLVDDARSPDVRAFLAAIEDDQGSMLQLSPESMDLVVASFADRPGVLYQSTASMAPAPGARRLIGSLKQPWRTLSLSLFFALHGITARHSARYPCAAVAAEGAWAGDDTEALLARAFGASPSLTDNDGVVPIRSQLWGTLVWAGRGDHLDVLGHYHDDREEVEPARRHRDWLTSGSDFGHAQFSELLDAIAAGMLKV